MPIRKVTSRDDVEYDPNVMLRRGPVLRSHRDSDGEWSGNKYLEVISGPKS